MKKGVLVGLVILLFLSITTLSACNTVQGAVKDTQSTFTNIKTGSSGWSFYDKNKLFIDLIVMFTFFTSLTLFAFRTTMGKRQEITALSISFGVALTIAAMYAGISPMFLQPFVKSLGFLLVMIFGMMFWRKVVGLDNKFWAFVLAIPFAIIYLFLMSAVFDGTFSFNPTAMVHGKTNTNLYNLGAQQKSAYKILTQINQPNIIKSKTPTSSELNKNVLEIKSPEVKIVNTHPSLRINTFEYSPDVKSGGSYGDLAYLILKTDTPDNKEIKIYSSGIDAQREFDLILGMNTGNPYKATLKFTQDIPLQKLPEEWSPDTNILIPESAWSKINVNLNVDGTPMSFDAAMKKYTSKEASQKDKQKITLAARQAYTQVAEEYKKLVEEANSKRKSN